MTTDDNPTNLILWLLLGASIGFIVMGFWLLAELDRWLWNRRRQRRRGGWIK